MHFDDTFLARWLAGTLTAAEREEFEQSPDYADYVRLQQGLEQLSPPAFSAEKSWRKLQAKLPVKAMPEPAPTFRTWRRALLAVAAAAVLALAAWWFFNPVRDTVVQTSVAEKRDLSLPDGSQLTLNAASKISYQASGWNDQRRLTLEGEAYFAVTPGSTFAVSTRGGTVTVLGTKFNVYAREGQALDVTCYEGRVRVTAGGNTQEVTLTGGQSVRVARSGPAAVAVVADTLPPWSRGESSFQSTRLRVVLDEMERQYGVQIQLVRVDGERTFTGKFLHGNLAEALQMVCTPMRLRYSIEAKMVRVSPQ